ETGDEDRGALQGRRALVWVLAHVFRGPRGVLHVPGRCQEQQYPHLRDRGLDGGGQGGYRGRSAGEALARAAEESRRSGLNRGTEAAVRDARLGIEPGVCVVCGVSDSLARRATAQLRHPPTPRSPMTSFKHRLRRKRAKQGRRKKQAKRRAAKKARRR